MDDITVNVRQIAQYPSKAQALPSDLLLVQTGGLGGPYQTVSVLGALTGGLDTPNATLNVGIPLPIDSAMAGVLASNLVTPLGCRQGFNWYNNSVGGESLLRGGAAGRWCFDGNTLSWTVSNAGAMGQPIAAWVCAFSVDASGNLTAIGQGQFACLDILGDATIGGNLAVEGNENLAGNLIVNGSTSLANTAINGTLGVTGNATFASNVVIGGTGTIGTLQVVGNGSVGGALAVAGPLSSASLNTGAINATNGAFSGSLGVGGNINANGNIAAAGSGTFGNLRANGNLVTYGTLTAYGATTLGNTLTLSGAATLNNALTVGGVFEAMNLAAFDANVLMGRNCDICGQLSAGSAYVSGTSFFEGTVGVCGDLSMGGNLEVGGIASAASPPSSADGSQLVTAQWVQRKLRGLEEEGEDVVSGIIPPIKVRTEPPHPRWVGDAWWDSVRGNLYIWYVDGGHGAWVIANTARGERGERGEQGPPGESGGGPISFELGDPESFTAGQAPPKGFYTDRTGWSALFFDGDQMTVSGSVTYYPIKFKVGEG